MYDAEKYEKRDKIIYVVLFVGFVLLIASMFIFHMNVDGLRIFVIEKYDEIHDSGAILINELRELIPFNTL